MNRLATTNGLCNRSILWFDDALTAKRDRTNGTDGQTEREIAEQMFVYHSD